jgi:hypothetical protein
MRDILQKELAADIARRYLLDQILCQLKSDKALIGDDKLSAPFPENRTTEIIEETGPDDDQRKPSNNAT